MTDLITMARPIFWPFATHVWVATHTLRTTVLYGWFLSKIFYFWDCHVSGKCIPTKMCQMCVPTSGSINHNHNHVIQFRKIVRQGNIHVVVRFWNQILIPIKIFWPFWFVLDFSAIFQYLISLRLRIVMRWWWWWWW